MMPTNQNANEYEHLRQVLVTAAHFAWPFEKVKDCIDQYGIAVDDDDFIRFFKLHCADVDISWLMRHMTKYNKSLMDALIAYITHP